MDEVKLVTLTRSNLESVELGFTRTLMALLLAFLPSKLKVSAYRFGGARIGKHVSIGFGSIVSASSFTKISIGDYSQIRQFTLIICSDVSIGSYSEIAMFVWIWGAGNLRIGDKCYVGPRCIINIRRNSFEMGEYAGLGPGSVAYTHGQWLPYTQGWPRTYGDVTLEEYAWVPAKVFLSPGVRIGKKSIVGSGAVVTKDIPPFSFAAGVPARVIGPVERTMKQIDREELFRRVMEIAEDLPHFFGLKWETRQIEDKLAVVQFNKRRGLRHRKWCLVVCEPELADKLKDCEIDPACGRIVFSTGPLSEVSRKSCYSWYDLNSLRCSDISDSFAFEIWDFLRHTWCVTCTASSS